MVRFTPKRRLGFDVVLLAGAIVGASSVVGATPNEEEGADYVLEERNPDMREQQKGHELAERLGLFWIDNESGRPTRAYDYIAVKGYEVQREASALAANTRIRSRDTEERLLLEAQWLHDFSGPPAEARRAAYGFGLAHMREAPPKEGYDRVVVVLDAPPGGGSPQALVVDQLRGAGKLDPQIVRARLQRVVDGRGEPDRKVLALGVATDDGYSLLVDTPAGVSPGRVERLISDQGARAASGAGYLVQGSSPAAQERLTATLGALLGEDPKGWLAGRSGVAPTKPKTKGLVGSLGF